MHVTGKKPAKPYSHLPPSEITAFLRTGTNRNPFFPWHIINKLSSYSATRRSKHLLTVRAYRWTYIHRVSQEEWTKFRESVPYVKLHRYNQKHLYPKLNGYGDNGHRKVWAYGVSTYCKPSVTPYSSTAHARQRDTTS